jgi:hypothetical protein
MPERRFRLKSCTEKAYAQILDSMEVIQLLFLFQRANALTDIKDPRADRSQGNSAEDGARGFIRRVAALLSGFFRGSLNSQVGQDLRIFLTRSQELVAR